MTTNTLDAPALDRSQAAQDFTSIVQGHMPDDHIANAVSAMQAADTAYPISNGSIIGGVFYVRVTAAITVNGRVYNFYGNGGGLFTPGGGALMGDIYTSDAVRLVTTTVSFQVNATPVYVNVNFFDNSSNLLGSLHTGAVSTVVGIGGGTGSWI